MSDLPVLEFDVIGTPVPQGSLSKGFGHHLRYSNDAKLKLWRHMAIHEICEAVAKLDGKWSIDQSVSVTADFRFTRPKKHYTGTGKLKEGVPYYKPTPSDCDKLQRAIGDALTQSGALRDDALIVHWDAWKRYAHEGEPPGVSVTVEVVK